MWPTAFRDSRSTITILPLRLLPSTGDWASPRALASQYGLVSEFTLLRSPCIKQSPPFCDLHQNLPSNPPFPSLVLA